MKEGEFVPKKKHLRKALSCIFAFMLIAVLLGTVTVGANILTEEVTVIINDDGIITELRTRKASVREILLQAKVEIGEHDYIDKNLNDVLTAEENNINIKRAVPVKVAMAEDTLAFHTTEDTVRHALAEQNIKLNKWDILKSDSTQNEISRYETITENMQIRLIRGSEEIIQENTVLPYEIVTKESGDLAYGQTRVTQKGVPGNKVTTYNAVYQDGKLIEKELIEEKVEKEPVNEIREVGTMMSFTTARGAKVGYKKELMLKASAYTAASVRGKKPGDANYGITATGMRAKVGVVAVDRSVIPLGTKLYVESLDSTKDYGYCIAVDTGVYGKKIDLYFNTVSECFQFGRRNVRVYVLKDQSVDVFAMR